MKKNKSNTNKGGAPKKPEDEKIFKGYKIYLTKREHLLFEQFISQNQLEHLSKNQVLKKIIDLKTASKQIKIVKKTDPQFLQNLNKIGVNLNQIAKKLNSGDSLNIKVKQKLIENLSKIDKLMHT